MPRGTDGSKSEEDKTASSSACKCNVCDPLGLPWHELRRELLRIAGLLVKGHPGAQTILLPLRLPVGAAFYPPSLKRYRPASAQAWRYPQALPRRVELKSNYPGSGVIPIAECAKKTQLGSPSNV